MADQTSVSTWEAALRRVAPCAVFLRDEPMAKHTTFRLGGPADLLIVPSCAEELVALLAACDELRVPLLVIGQGSNLIVRDGGLRGVVIKLAGGLTVVERRGDSLFAEAGVPVSKLAEMAGEAGLTGLEFAIGIPGSLGGAIFMNAGAYDGEIGPLVKWCRVVSPRGEVRVLQSDELHFGYRHSVLQEEPLYAIEAELALTPGDPGEILAKMADLTERRQSKQPLELPSAGSVFRRPEGHFVGQLINDAGLRGFRIGGAQVSEKHTGFIVNAGGATAKDVLALIAHVQATVEQKYGVRLATEVRVVGE